MRFYTGWVRLGLPRTSESLPLIPLIVLQNSKVAAPRIFRENKKRETITDLYTLSRVPRSPVSLTREDQSPHVLTRKTRLQPAEFLITCAKRLLQHNPPNYGHKADIARGPSRAINDQSASQQMGPIHNAEPRPLALGVCARRADVGLCGCVCLGGPRNAPGVEILRPPRVPRACIHKSAAEVIIPTAERTMARQG